MMSEDMLSQDEIDALLKGSADEDIDETNNSTDEIVTEDYLDMIEQDALGEIGNISFGSSATALSTLLNQKVEITTPKVSIIDRNNLDQEFPHPYVAIQVQYTEGFSGTNMLVIKQSDASIIADLMLGGDGLNPSADLGEIQLSAVQEAMNQMMGSAATSMSTVFSKKVDISPPTVDLMYLPDGKGEENIPNKDLLVKAQFSLKIGELIDSNIMQLLPLPFAKGLVHDLMNGGVGDVEEETQESPLPANNFQEEVNPSPRQSNRSATATLTKREPVPQHIGGQREYSQQPVNVEPATFTSFETPSLSNQEAQNLDMLLDIPLQVTVELGRTKRNVKDILELSKGSIIELDKLAGEPVDILVNSRLIAKGEVVVIDENFGVRVTDIASPTDRLKRLK